MNPKHLLKAPEEQNISLSELSRRTGVPKSNLSSWLKGRSPNLEQLNKIAECLNLSIVFLAFDKKDRPRDQLIYRTIVEQGSYEELIKKIG